MVILLLQIFSKWKLFTILPRHVSFPKDSFSTEVPLAVPFVFLCVVKKLKSQTWSSHMFQRDDSYTREVSTPVVLEMTWSTPKLHLVTGTTPSRLIPMTLPVPTMNHPTITVEEVGEPPHISNDRSYSGERRSLFGTGLRSS